MIEIMINQGGHNWVKINNVTQKDRNGLYDIIQCSKCGIKGKRYCLDSVHVYERFKNKLRCSVVSKRVKVIACAAFGPQFSHLTKGSIHEVISPPSGQNNDRGEWVMGVGEPVLLLFGEFTYVEEGGEQ